MSAGHIRYALAFAAAALLWGCTSTPLEVAAPPQIVIQKHVLARLPLGGSLGVSDSEFKDIEAVLADAGVSDPATVHATLVNVDAITREEAVAALRTLGLPLGNIAVAGAGSIKDGGGASLVLARYKAIPPHCEQRVLVAGLPRDNTTDAGFGCATLVDLALSVADPKDLLGRPNVVLSEGPRATRPVTAYRRFNTPEPAPPAPAVTTAPAR